ncbi:MAG: DUF5615 family PIN-like protein [Dehalococcoidia bacterium]
MARLYLDEQMGNFAAPLRDAGHDVLFSVDHGGQGRTDPWQFREALSSGRVLLTFNRGHFQYIHRLWTTLQTLQLVEQAHPGVLASTRVVAPAEWLPALADELNQPEGLTGRIRSWHPDTGQWHDDEWKPEMRS